MPSSPFAGLQISATPFGVGDKKVGEKLTALYRDAQDAELAILRFGAAFWAVEQVVLATCGQNSGPGAYGFATWLADHAPEISRTTARRYRDIAEATAERFKIADPVRVFSLPVDQLDKQDQAKRAKVCEFMAEKSMRGIQLELGLVSRMGAAAKGGDLGGRRKAAADMSPAEIAQAQEATRAANEKEWTGWLDMLEATGLRMPQWSCLPLHKLERMSSLLLDVRRLVDQAVATERRAVKGGRA
jgi:hypothetical protein